MNKRDYATQPLNTPMWLIPWITRTHVAVYKITRGTIGSNLAGHPGILIRTVGRKSGKSHTICVSYMPWGDDMVVVASYGGADKHPDWYLNMMANQEVIIRNKKETFWADVNTIEEPEYTEIWEELIQTAPWYQGYKTKTSRKIPLLKLSFSRPYMG